MSISSPVPFAAFSSDHGVPGSAQGAGHAAANPALLAEHLGAAAAALQAADGEGARRAYLAACAYTPPVPEAFHGLALALDLLGQASDALACRMACLALRNQIEGAAGSGSAALDIYNIGTAYLMTGRKPSAEFWYRLALRVDSELVVAHRNLAVLLRDTGRHDEAQRHTDAAYRRQYVFDSAPAGLNPGAPTVLLICAAGRGNVPIELWFAAPATRRIEYMLAYAPADADAATLAALPPSTLIFNAIGDPDVAAEILPRLNEFVAHAGRPLLNSPRAVALTARDKLPLLLAGIPDLLLPEVQRVERAQFMARQLPLDAAGAAWLVRPVATHGGEGLVKLDRAAAVLAHLQHQTAGAFYLTRFCDFRSADGYFRKYRMIFIDGRPYPYHLAISSTWLVHYFSAEMLEHAWKQAEEARFLSDPHAVLGARAMAALTVVGARLGLDYAGIDFSQLADGRVVVFEANATMLVHPEPADSPLAYKNMQVEAMRLAFAAMLERRIERGERE
jgi:hypothetical protein